MSNFSNKIFSVYLEPWHSTDAYNLENYKQITGLKKLYPHLKVNWEHFQHFEQSIQHLNCGALLIFVPLASLQMH